MDMVDNNDKFVRDRQLALSGLRETLIDLNRDWFSEDDAVPAYSRRSYDGEYEKYEIVIVKPSGLLSTSRKAYETLGEPKRMKVYLKGSVVAIKGASGTGSTKVCGGVGNYRVVHFAARNFTRKVRAFNGDETRYYFALPSDGYLIFDYNNPYKVEKKEKAEA